MARAGGKVPELAARGITNKGSGAPRGTVVTASGLIFTGTPDNTFQWSTRTPERSCGTRSCR